MLDQHFWHRVLEAIGPAVPEDRLIKALIYYPHIFLSCLRHTAVVPKDRNRHLQGETVGTGFRHLCLSDTILTSD